MSRYFLKGAVSGLVALLASTTISSAQQRPYIGFAYPAGGQTGTTFSVNISGQYLDGVNGVYISGKSVKGKIIDYQKHLNPQEIMLLREQLDELKKSNSPGGGNQENKEIIAKLEKRISEYVLRPQSVSISNRVFAEIRIDADAKPGERELRLLIKRGEISNPSNPLIFYVGQLPEYSFEPMPTSPLQVLGKEEEAIRKKPEKKLVVPKPNQ